jgi:hypothetical protein
MDIKQEDLIRFWTWCDWIYRRSNPNHFQDSAPEVRERDMGWYHPLDEGRGLAKIPQLCIENIYRYAIPKLQEKMYATELMAWGIRGFTVKIYNAVEQKYVSESESDNPTEALYKAIMEIIKNGTTN